MKIAWLTLVLICLVEFPAVAQSQQDDYQQGKILSIKQLPPAAAPYEGDEATLKASVTSYNVSTQVGDTVYVYQYKVETGEIPPWDVGQTQQVNPKGNVMHVKMVNGQDETYSIVSKSKAKNQSPQ